MCPLLPQWSGTRSCCHSRCLVRANGCGGFLDGGSNSRELIYGGHARSRGSHICRQDDESFDRYWRHGDQLQRFCPGFRLTAAKTGREWYLNTEAIQSIHFLLTHSCCCSVVIFSEGIIALFSTWNLQAQILGSSVMCKSCTTASPGIRCGDALYSVLSAFRANQLMMGNVVNLLLGIGADLRIGACAGGGGSCFGNESHLFL